MAKVTSRYQVTVPNAIAQQYSIRPDDDIDWVAAGDVIRVVPGGKHAQPQATERHGRRRLGRKKKSAQDRAWTRDDL